MRRQALFVTDCATFSGTSATSRCDVPWNPWEHLLCQCAVQLPGMVTTLTIIWQNRVWDTKLQMATFSTSFNAIQYRLGDRIIQIHSNLRKLEPWIAMNTHFNLFLHVFCFVPCILVPVNVSFKRTLYAIRFDTTLSKEHLILKVGNAISDWNFSLSATSSSGVH